MASKKPCLVASLCCIVILSTFIGSAHSASCCLMYTRRPIPCKRLMGYTIQNINTSCDINAIIFHVRGRFVCANPASKWTQDRMRCFDERRKKSAQIIKERAANTTSSA